MKKWLTLLFVMVLALLITACSGNTDSTDNNQNESDNPIEKANEDATNGTSEEIVVSLNNLDGDKAAEATLIQDTDGVKIQIKGDGFPKETKQHAFHIHEKGICEPEDKFESAGGHYNPHDKEHGKHADNGHHAGDFENIDVKDGKVDIEFTTDQISLDEDADNTVFSKDGTSFVIHDGTDDYKSQPAGDAGDRIICGVIAEPK